MWQSLYAAAVCTLVALPGLSVASIEVNQFYSMNEDLLLQRNPFNKYDNRPDDCPPCFNCNLEDFKCQQFANCSIASGKCSCPSGFGGEDCSQPLCGSLAHGNDRLPRVGNEPCQCEEGWGGINCNLCNTNQACDALMPADTTGGVCYQDGLVVKENYQMCDITNRKIVEMLKERKAQATFGCNAEREECNFQFWVDEVESFYCALDTCAWKMDVAESQNTTDYTCENIKCRCIPDRFLCGQDGSFDISDFLVESIKGPASFSSLKTTAGESSSAFTEPAMNDLIANFFGDKSILLKCRSGECLYKTEVPGYERPVKQINTPLIAGVIAGCALFIVAVVLLIFFLSRRNSQRGYAPISLGDEEEEENAKLLADHKPAALYFEKVSYNLKGKQILSNISGSVHPGELMAIMGASGAGKTSFLDLLARKNKRGTVTGGFYLNGDEVSDTQFRNVIGFVDQDDTMLPTLTVHETILDSALLRLPREMSRAAKEQKVEDVERQLGIYHIRNQIIGSEEGNGRGISGGEKRRVGIACELVTSPSILFLDEPTSGLDAFNAFNVIECLVTLVKTYNRTVVFTIHQPRSNIVALFDRLVLLAQGRAVYSGPFKDCQAHFDNVGFACPPGFNIADYLVDLTMHASVPSDLAGLDDLYHDSAEGNGTRASSTIAVKSVPSTSNFSTDDLVGSTGADSSLRPKSYRKLSVRQQQERQLYLRQNTQDGTTPSILSAGDSLLERGSARTDDVQDHPTTAPFPHTGLDDLVKAYDKSEIASDIRTDLQHAIEEASAIHGETNGNGKANKRNKITGYRKPLVHQQFFILSRRTWRNLYRNPMLMLTHYAIAIVLAVFLGFLFYGLSDDLKGFQNRLGFFFFLLALFGFSTLTSLTVFAPERLLFLRERAKGYYTPAAYYLSKVVFDIVPLRLIPPFIMGCIVYPMTGLVTAWDEFLKFMLFLVLFNLAAAMICLCIGICVRNQGVANLFGVLVMLFSLLFGGFLLNHETIPKPLLWLQSLSIYHYGFEGLIVNEVRYLTLTDKKYGLNIEVPGSTILSTFGFNVLALWTDVLGLSVFCGVFLVVGYIAIHFLLVEQR